ncbi:MAG: hypothetical protein FJ293_10185 [Planctomycetes bacterium]|nr:hypothetical protein [Planctomycetota bacterium]
MDRSTRIAPLLAALLAAGCVNTVQTGRLVETGGPDAASPFQYHIVGPVTGTGSTTAISPFLPSLPGIAGGMDAAIGRATDYAVGGAIYNRDDIDVVLNPKRRIVTNDYFVFGLAKVEVKGLGAAIERPAAVNPAPAKQ